MEVSNKDGRVSIAPVYTQEATYILIDGLESECCQRLVLAAELLMYSSNMMSRRIGASHGASDQAASRQPARKKLNATTCRLGTRVLLV
jgi:hypothetical protein